MSTCSVEGCEGVTGVPGTARGLCSKHYNRMRRHGSTDDTVVAWMPRGATCSVEGCESKHEAKGFCAKHYQRVTRHGDINGGHHHWGEVPGYQRVHQIVREARGPASDYPCVDGCGQQAQEWAYDHKDPNELIGKDHGKAVPYSLDLDRYISLCVPCHRLLDSPNQKVSMT